MEGHPTLTAVAEALLAAREALGEQLRGLEKRLRDQAREDERTRLLMTTPGVGVIVALTFAAAVDDPGWFRSSKRWARTSGRRRGSTSPGKRT